MKKMIFSILVLILLIVGLMSYETMTKDSNGETIVFNNDLSQVTHYDIEDTIILYDVSFEIEKYQVVNDEYLFYFKTPLSQKEVSSLDEKGLMLRTGHNDGLTNEHIGGFTTNYLKISKKFQNLEVSSFNQICIANYNKEIIELVINLKEECYIP